MVPPRNGDSTPCAAQPVKATPGVSPASDRLHIIFARCIRLISKDRPGDLMGTDPPRFIFITCLVDRRFRRSILIEELRLADWLRYFLQCDLQHLVDPFHWLDDEVCLDVVRDLPEIRLVLFRDDDGFYSAPMGSQQLFLKSANTQHLPT